MRATEIAALLATQAESVCHHLLPNGRITGHDWSVGSINGEAGNSMKVTLSGSKAGVWCDFGGAPEDRGDLIGLWMRVRKLTLEETCRECLDWLNLPHDAPPTVNRPVSKPIPNRAPGETWLRIQAKMRKGTVDELAHVSHQRKLPAFAGLQLMSNLGVLFFGPVWDDGEDHEAWIITDSTRLNAQARRMDGQLWSKGKAKTIHGIPNGTWPVGLGGINTPEVALVEGGPDLLAAWYLVWFMGKVGQVTPVAMLGASSLIPADALALFARKRVWMFPHSDDNQAGQMAASRWTEQLLAAGARPMPFDLSPDKDLNEFVISTTEEIED